MDEEELKHKSQGELYTELMRKQVPHVPPPALYGDDMRELIAGMMDYNPETRLSVTEVFKRLSEMTSSNTTELF